MEWETFWRRQMRGRQIWRGADFLAWPNEIPGYKLLAGQGCTVQRRNVAVRGHMCGDEVQRIILDMIALPFALHKLPLRMTIRFHLPCKLASRGPGDFRIERVVGGTSTPPNRALQRENFEGGYELYGNS
jgi:hypothetical protein